ncbi:MAG: glycerol-3-phosphate 1-O-acyltransferase PlsY [Tepidisphaeraceae bacterium]|jgi:glycerol-3-phosphate acyltransferase PlsY
MPKDQFILLSLVPAGYLLGAIPFGLLVGLAKGIDPRKAGSGNIGATNIGRLLGGRFFAIVFVLDMLKSLLPMLVAGWIVHRFSAGATTPLTYLLWISVGVAAVLGHMFSVFLGFKGGKGVSTAAGLLLGIYPYYTLPALAAIMVFIIVFRIWRYVSLAAITAAGLFPLLHLAYMMLIARAPVFGPTWPLLAAAVLVAALILVRHRSNIKRLIDGTEQGFRKPRGP